MKIQIIISLASLLFVSCSSELTEERTLELVLNKKSNKLYDLFYQNNKVNAQILEELVVRYANAIEKKGLKQAPFRDAISLKSRKRLGALFVDENNYLHYSITFKFTTLKNGKKLINYMDFRSSEEDLPCLKIPSNFPIKCAKTPIPKPPNPTEFDSLKARGPEIINDFKVYPLVILSEKYLAERGDTLKREIAFNFGNKRVKDHIESLLTSLDARLDLSNYTLSYFYTYAQPTLNILCDQNHFSEEEISLITTSVEEVMPGRVAKRINLKASGPNPRIGIGGVYATAKFMRVNF